MRVILVSVAILLAFCSVAFAHCQLPCGIYNDETRFAMLGENIITIERAMKMIVDLSDDAEPNHNQIVRWVDAKNQHADDIAHVVSWYFLQQRVKPVDGADAAAHEAYVHKLTLLHEMLLYSMKAKQTTDLSHVEKLETLLDDFARTCMGED